MRAWRRLRPSGKRLLVAAARGKTLHVFDATTYDHISDAPMRQRCWHFSFTPVGSKVMLACGRSNAVYLLDASSFGFDTVCIGMRII
jgi:DNA-binding beta-propeller fold protein YncE